MEDPAITDRKVKRLRQLLAGIDNVYFNIKSERHSYYQALLSLGDRRVAPAIEAAERNGGNWRAAVAETGVDADFYIFRDRIRRRRAAVGHHRRRHEDVVLPGRVRQGARARSGRCRRSGRRRTPASCRSCSSDRSGSARASQLDGRHDATAASASYSCIRLQDQIADPVLRRRVADRPQQREAAALAVDRVLARRERDVAAVAGSCAPRRRSQSASALRAGPAVKCSSASASLPGGLPLSFGTILIVTVSLL